MGTTWAQGCVSFLGALCKAPTAPPAQGGVPSLWLSLQPSRRDGLFFTRHFLLIRPLVLVLINQLVLNLIKTYTFLKSQRFQSYFILIVPDLIGTSHRYQGETKAINPFPC